MKRHSDRDPRLAAFRFCCSTQCSKFFAVEYFSWEEGAGPQSNGSFSPLKALSESCTPAGPSLRWGYVKEEWISC